MSNTASLSHTTPRLPTVPPRQLLIFGVIAVTSGWVLLSVPAVLNLPVEPFILGTLIIGLVLPALVISFLTPGLSALALLRSVFRPPHPLWILAPAALTIPTTVWLAASIAGVAIPLDAARLGVFALEMLSSVLIINLWEEMAWTGFFQQSVSARRGVLVGSLVTALLFAAVHLALAISEAESAGDVGAGLAVLFTSAIALRLAIGALYDTAGRSILAVALFHASFNSAGGLVTPGHDAIRIGVVGLVGVAALLFVTVRARRPLNSKGGGS